MLVIILEDANMGLSCQALFLYKIYVYTIDCEGTLLKLGKSTHLRFLHKKPFFYLTESNVL